MHHVARSRSAPLLRLAQGMLVATALSGCAALLGGAPAPLDTFELTAPDGGQEARRGAGRQILVAEPTALKVLDGQEIVIKPSPRSIEFLKGAQWADRLPRVVQARLVEALQRSGHFGGVGKPGEGLAIDYQVVVEVRAFEIEVEGGDRASIALFVKLLNDRNGVVRASRLFEAGAAVSGSGNAAFVEALDRAFNQVAAEIVAWTAATI